jgi:hypothetical protein
MKELRKLQKAVDKFNEELALFNSETGEDVATLYEDINTYFTLSSIKVEIHEVVTEKDECDGEEYTYNVYKLSYEYDECEQCDIVDYEEAKDYLSFYKKCLKRAWKYWRTECDILDAMAEGLMEDNGDDE